MTVSPQNIHYPVESPFSALNTAVEGYRAGRANYYKLVRENFQAATTYNPESFPPKLRAALSGWEHNWSAFVDLCNENIGEEVVIEGSSSHKFSFFCTREGAEIVAGSELETRSQSCGLPRRPLHDTLTLLGVELPESEVESVAIERSSLLVGSSACTVIDMRSRQRQYSVGFRVPISTIVGIELTGGSA